MARVTASQREPLPSSQTSHHTMPYSAAAYIRGLILNRDLRAGDHVNQDAVAAALGISRIPVREALVALEREGWVTVESHRGAFVNAVDEQSVHDYYDILGHIYAFAAERAAVRGSKEQIDNLSKLAEELEASDDPEVVRDIAFAFHAGVVNAAASPRVKVILRSMSSLVAGNLFEEVPATIELERTTQLWIVRALRLADGAAAGLEYARLMSRIGDAVVAHFNEKGLFNAA
jgi:DNA-binding GntR family transcriptional regulator